MKQKGGELFKAGKYEEALQSYEKAFELYKSTTLLNNISTCYLKLDQFEKALEKATEALDFGREHSASFQEIAKALAK